MKIFNFFRNFFKKDSSIRWGGELNFGGELHPFSIVPSFYEKEMDKKYGIVLGELKNKEKSGFKGDLEKNLYFRKGYVIKSNPLKKLILNRSKKLPGFCSMVIENEEELMKHVKFVYELSYIHYVFGKENNIGGNFPQFACGESSRNLFLSLMERGYYNASLISSAYDHAYVGLPFLFGKNKEKGFIISDPTSDQLFDNKEHRNNLFVVAGTTWEYKTHWSEGRDLFANSGFLNLHTLRSKGKSQYLYYEFNNIDEYFAKVFKTPVRMKISSI